MRIPKCKWAVVAPSLALLLLIPILANAAADEATLGGPFSLVDQNGTPRTERDFHGFYPLIFFGFTHCPDLCPRSLVAMTTAIDELAARAPEKAKRVVPVFITVDPARDTVATMKSYVANFHPRLVGLTGSAEEIERVTREYGAFYAPVPQGGGDYAMDHSGFILLMGPKGEYVTHFESNVRAAELAEELERRVTQ
jgi:cytochrome oxidase Cu insertion factor (SCO1/SenC/PrrC family)